MKSFIAIKVSVVDSGPHVGSTRYPTTGFPSIAPSPYWPNATKRKTSSELSGTTSRRTLAFSSRTASAAKEFGGSIAKKQSNCSR